MALNLLFKTYVFVVRCPETLIYFFLILRKLCFKISDKIYKKSQKDDLWYPAFEKRFIENVTCGMHGYGGMSERNLTKG